MPPSTWEGFTLLARVVLWKTLDFPAIVPNKSSLSEETVEDEDQLDGFRGVTFKCSVGYFFSNFLWCLH